MWRFFLDNRNHLFLLLWILPENRAPGASASKREHANYTWRLVHFDEIDWVLTAEKELGFTKKTEIMLDMSKSWDRVYIDPECPVPPRGLYKSFEDLDMTKRILSKDSNWKGPVQAAKAPTQTSAKEMSKVSISSHVLPTKVEKRTLKSGPKTIQESVVPPERYETEDEEEEEPRIPPLGWPSRKQMKRLTEEEKIQLRRERDRERKRVQREQAKKRQELGLPVPNPKRQKASPESPGTTSKNPPTVQESVQEQHNMGFPPPSPLFQNVPPYFHPVPPFHSPDFLQLFELPYKQCKADTEKMFGDVMALVSNKLQAVEDQLRSIQNSTTDRWNKLSTDMSSMSAKTSADIFEMKRIIDTMPTSKAITELKKKVDNLDDHIQKQLANSVVNINSFRDVYKMLHGHDLPSTSSTSMSTTYERPQETYQEPPRPRDDQPKQVIEEARGPKAPERDPSRIPKKSQGKQQGRGRSQDRSNRGRDKPDKRPRNSPPRSPKRDVQEETPTPQREERSRSRSPSQDRDIPENRRRRRD